MAKIWKPDIDLTFKEGVSENERNRTIAAQALGIHYKTGKIKVNVLVDGSVRVEASVQNHLIRIMECIAEIPLERRIGRFVAVEE
jgi:hypothetical protein